MKAPVYEKVILVGELAADIDFLQISEMKLEQVSVQSRKEQCVCAFNCN